MIYISPEIIAKTKGVQSYSDMLSPDSFHAFDIIAEETGHFLYTQVQYVLHGETPGHILGEGMALVDNYQVLRKALEEKGQNIFDPSDPFVREFVAEYVKKISERGEIAHKVFKAGGYHPTASAYTKSVEVMSGFVKHLVNNDREGQDTSSQLYRVYRMTGPQKGRYLRDLYTNYVQEGDNWYQAPLEHVTDRVRYEYEFEDEGVWREKWEEAKGMPIWFDPF